MSCEGAGRMQIKFVSAMVEDQDQVLEFYAKMLGFERMADIPMGEHPWLTVTSPEGIDGLELVLEPMAFPLARVYQKALFDAGLPAAAFTTEDIAAEFDRLRKLGVTCRSEPAEAGPNVAAQFEDTCGNLIYLVQPKG